MRPMFRRCPADGALAPLAALSSSQLMALAEALLDVPSPEELFAWLRTHPPPRNEEAGPEAV